MNNDNIELRKEKKKLNSKFYEFTQNSKINMTDKTKDRIKDCGTFLEFLGDEKLENFKLNSGNFCGNRFCPQCNYNRSRKLGLELLLMVKYIQEKFNFKFLFLTLTAPNVNGQDLKNELNSYYESFKKLFKRKEIQSISLGYIRKFEITYNSQRNDYHPHYHILIAVKPSYFSSRNYISRDRWLKLWQLSKRNNIITQVDIRRVDGKNLESSIIELSKYLSKDSDYLYSKDVFEIFYKNLKGKRYISFSGIFKDVRELYNCGFLDYLKEIDEIEYIYKIYYIWNNSDYNLKDVIFLSDEEKEKYNFVLKEEI